jgi:hypothetical protein
MAPVAPSPKVAPKVTPKVAATPKPSPTPKPIPSPSPKPSPKPSPVASPTVKPSPVASPSSTPLAKPSPAPKVISAQDKLADLRTQLGKVAGGFGEGLVQDVTLNPTTNRLRVQLKDKWYDLGASQQDQLAQKLLESSVSADFSKLELADSQSRIVARSPIVGTEVVVLRRMAA